MIIGKALVVGGGIGGMAAAISLARRGVAVELIDIDPEWRVYGAGITIIGPTLRAYRNLGMFDRIKQLGAVTNHQRLRLFDGTVLRVLEEPVIEEGLPATAGIMRPILHGIMQDGVCEAGVPVRLGLTVTALENTASGVNVTFSDGTADSYGLVIGADSINSTVRDLSFPHMGPAMPTGQGCWRISMRKPPEQDMGEFYFGSANPCGITICGEDAIYLFLLTPHEPREEHLTDAQLYTALKAHLQPFGGNAGWVRDNMSREDWINYRPLVAGLQPGPWFNGRIVLIGDAIHATTPHLASGAGMAVESAIMLAQELERAETVEAGLQAYQDRRFERCRDVIDTSVKIGQLQLEHGRPDQIAALIEGAMARLNEDY